MRLIQYDDDRTINVQGIDNHQVPQLRLGKLGAVAKAKHGDVEVLLIFSQYAHLQRGKSIHSSLQLDDNNVEVNDRPIHVLPLDFKRGLATSRFNCIQITSLSSYRFHGFLVAMTLPTHHLTLAKKLLFQDGCDEMGEMLGSIPFKRLFQQQL